TTTKHALSAVILCHPTRTRSPAIQQPTTTKGRPTTQTHQLVAEKSRTIRERDKQSAQKLPTQQLINRETRLSRTQDQETNSR
ncbi:GntR family transcriptional regulator, partial [Pseudomonas syringae pv. tagetis]